MEYETTLRNLILINYKMDENCKYELLDNN